MTAIAWAFPIALTWITETPVVVKQWPLKGESLLQAHTLVAEQLQLGHVVPSVSPWNTPIFVIKKKSGSFRLLHDLRAINLQMEPMGALQPGLPNPAMIPKDWSLLVIDLKDCFFTIPLHPNDTKRFAFTLPAQNRGEPDRRFEWTVLPQGMRNSPTLCQLFVDTALQPIRKILSEVIIYHYMDDLLFAQRKPFSSEQLQMITALLHRHGLKVSEEKIQFTAPWKYLGWVITNRQIRPQKLLSANVPTTLHEAQKLMGDLQWLKPVTGIPNDLLDMLRPLLKGTDPASPVTLSEEQLQAFQQIMHCVTTGFVSRYDPTLPLGLAVWNSEEHLLGAIVQIKKTGDGRQDTSIIEWLTPQLQQRKTITKKLERLAALIRKGRLRIIEISGQEPAIIHLPMEQSTLDWYLLNNDDIATALLNAPSLIITLNFMPNTLAWLGHWQWIQKPLGKNSPIPDAVTVFTDAGKRSRKAAATWKRGNIWHQHVLDAAPEDNLQTLELLAVIWALHTFQEPLNVISDSLYVVTVASRIEDAAIKEVTNPRLGQLFLSLKRVLRARTNPYAVLHIRSHKWEIGLGEGNARADKLVAIEQQAVVPRAIAARESHNIFHQNAKGLAKEFDISLNEARGIIRTCPVCSYPQGGVGLGMGVNPKGLDSNQLWQMDVTHVASFGKLKYVHVTIDTYSHYIWATAQTGEKALHVEKHLNSCIAVMGVPKELKTDNGPAYISERIARYTAFWGIKHTKGIPHNSMGQAVVERAHSTLKQYIAKYTNIPSPVEKLLRALFVLNHLCLFGEEEIPPAVKHFQKEPLPAPPVYVAYKDPATGVWQPPAQVLYWGRGYVCVSTPTGSKWIPARWTRASHVYEQPLSETTPPYNQPIETSPEEQ